MQRGDADLELLGGLGAIAAVGAQRRLDVLALDLLEGVHAPGGVDFRQRHAHLLGQIVRLDLRAHRQRHRALHRVLQFAHVARPVVAHQ